MRAYHLQQRPRQRANANCEISQTSLIVLLDLFGTRSLYITSATDCRSPLDSLAGVKPPYLLITLRIAERTSGYNRRHIEAVGLGVLKGKDGTTMSAKIAVSLICSALSRSLVSTRCLATSGGAPFDTCRVATRSQTVLHHLDIYCKEMQHKACKDVPAAYTRAPWRRCKHSRYTRSH